MIRRLKLLRSLLDCVILTLERRRYNADEYDRLPLLPWQDQLLREMDEQPLYPWLDEPSPAFVDFDEVV